MGLGGTTSLATRTAPAQAQEQLWALVGRCLDPWEVLAASPSPVPGLSVGAFLHQVVASTGATEGASVEAARRDVVRHEVLRLLAQGADAFLLNGNGFRPMDAWSPSQGSLAALGIDTATSFLMAVGRSRSQLLGWRPAYGPDALAFLARVEKATGRLVLHDKVPEFSAPRVSPPRP